ncbi:MAG: ATP-binding protein [Candidatus Bathyarchaeia archaeon]
MKIYKKEGDVIQIISFPNEIVEKGDYLLIEDPIIDKGLLVQVIDVQFANVPGVFEEILRDAVLDEEVEGENYDPMEVSSQISILKDTKLLICRIRGVLSNGEIIFGMNYLPSRTLSKIIPYKIENFINSTSRSRPFQVGKIRGEIELILDVKSLDGKLNIVTGKKGTGKSHLAKLLILNLIKYGAPCIIFDVNGEYINLNRKKTGEAINFGKFITLTPKVNMKFTLPQAKLTPVLNMMIYSLDLPSTSARVFIKIWRELDKRGELSLTSLGEAILRWDCHESVRDALYARYNMMVESGLFTDNINESLDFEFLMKSISNGGAVVVNLKNQSAMVRRMIVELTLNKLTELLSNWKLQAIFLFAEEAHLYLRETYWDDIVTRMRHLGIFATFITNQPDTIQETIYRQADNIFLFNFSNEHDLEVVSKTAKIDSETVKKIVKELPPHYCLIIGDIVNNFPVVVKVEPLEFETMGETRFFFKN